MKSPQASDQQPRASPLPSGASSSSTGHGSSRPEAQELPEDVFAQLHEHLEAIRAEVAQGNMEDRSYFNLKALGGDWSILQGKKHANNVQSLAKDKSVAKWCKNTFFPANKSFSTNLLWPHQCLHVGRGGGEKRRLFFRRLDRCWLPSPL